MGKLAIVRPLSFVVGANVAISNLSRIATPDPKEAVFLPAGAVSINFDVGSVQSIDTVFLGFTGSANWTASYSVDGISYTNLGAVRSDDVAPTLWTPVRHALLVAAAPVQARFVTVSATGLPADFPIGVAAVGAKLESFWGHEWGAGRPIEDTGTADRLLGGGFAINEGTVTSGYQWTFGDLTDQELRDLFALVRDRGTTRSALVVEDPDRTIGLHERIHWGLLDRLEAYERLQPGASRWNLKIRDWA